MKKHAVNSEMLASACRDGAEKLRKQEVEEKKRSDNDRRTYDRLFFELESDLIVLCESCHKKFHDLEIHKEDENVRFGEIAF